MIIKDIVARNIAIPLKEPKIIPGMKFTHREYTLVNIYTTDGLEGWSFAYGMPQTKAAIEEMKEILVGETVDIRRLYKKMQNSRTVRWDRGGISYRALSMIDIALWDLKSKSCNVPIYEMIGCYRKEVPVYYSAGYYPFSCTTNKQLLDYLDRDFGVAREKGFTAFKMKIGNADVAFDLERINVSRKAIGPNNDLMVDAFCAYDPETAISIARRFEQYDIAWFEEPIALDDIPNCAYVASHISMPLAIGESHYTMMQFRDIIDNGAVRILQPDLTYIGGFTGFSNLAGVAGMYNIKLAPHWCHDLCVQLAAAYPEVIALEYMDAESDSFLIQRVIENPVLADKGIVRPPQGSGHGLILDEKMVAKYLV